MLGGDELTETWNDFSYFEDDADDEEVCDGSAVFLLAMGPTPFTRTRGYAFPALGLAEDLPGASCITLNC
jgi:hypothetical protein